MAQNTYIFRGAPLKHFQTLTRTCAKHLPRSPNTSRQASETLHWNFATLHGGKDELDAAELPQGKPPQSRFHSTLCVVPRINLPKYKMCVGERCLNTRPGATNGAPGTVPWNGMRNSVAGGGSRARVGELGRRHVLTVGERDLVFEAWELASKSVAARRRRGHEATGFQRKSSLSLQEGLADVRFRSAQRADVRADRRCPIGSEAL